MYDKTWLGMQTADAHGQLNVWWTIHRSHLNAVKYLMSQKVSLKSHRWEKQNTIVTSYSKKEALDPYFEAIKNDLVNIVKVWNNLVHRAEENLQH